MDARSGRERKTPIAVCGSSHSISITLGKCTVLWSLDLTEQYEQLLKLLHPSENFEGTVEVTPKLWCFPDHVRTLKEALVGLKDAGLDHSRWEKITVILPPNDIPGNTRINIPLPYLKEVLWKGGHPNQLVCWFSFDAPSDSSSHIRPLENVTSLTLHSVVSVDDCTSILDQGISLKHLKIHNLANASSETRQIPQRPPLLERPLETLVVNSSRTQHFEHAFDSFTFPQLRKVDLNLQTGQLPTEKWCSWHLPWAQFDEVRLRCDMTVEQSGKIRNTKGANPRRNLHVAAKQLFYAPGPVIPTPPPPPIPAPALTVPIAATGRLAQSVFHI
ncbi:hypothetical protein H0H81_011802 [Sphagnurus paluster]|uniref:Uncharacterized protein n=1 Tax=Sphagnurus paluster TaxID=117069 RepID=A0A9P7FU13_9AGAR|nr:hypothetical protein H0H81_011802 [Sphagnurus paluster]